ncbi:MAG: type II toxin-antitoxin system RelE/ParE family toxin [Aphanocapsa sp. GSE-SYN-MK-11-07L]|jgi:mRNA interferase RelE/StbE|nr:type II toxin-antitoxin system RelE/ParE family toxin [Aphanocapsa sp. GSE-SYN-MK-11-07L]
MDYQVELTPLAIAMISQIKDRREQQGILERLKKLENDPLLQGKALTGDLKGYYSIRAVGQRYRIVYQVIQERIVVIVVGVGRRKEGDKNDIYNRLRKLMDDMTE